MERTIKCPDYHCENTFKNMCPDYRYENYQIIITKSETSCLYHGNKITQPQYELSAIDEEIECGRFYRKRGARKALFSMSNCA